ncbi:hypothetical protein BH11PLA1_BH11PLA1_20950 [soil metagenome]
MVQNGLVMSRCVRVRRAARMAACLGALALGAAALTGCDSTKAPYNAQPDPVTRADYPAVTVDGALQKGLKVEYGSIVFTPVSAERPASIVVPVRSSSDDDQAVAYQFRWYDASGVQIGASEWRREMLPARRNVQFRSNATSERAVRWMLDIKRSEGSV